VVAHQEMQGTPDSRIARVTRLMSEIWESRDATRTDALFTIANEALDDRARRALARDYRLDDDTVDDCIADAVTALLAMWRTDSSHIRSPYPWLWQTIQNRAATAVRTQIEERKTRAAPTVIAIPDLNEELATTWFEELAEVEIDEDVARVWVTEVISGAVARLPPILQRVARHMLESDFASNELTSDKSGELLNMSAAAFRQAKRRALEHMKTSIPQIIAELGIELSPRETESMIIFRPILGTDDDNQADVTGND